MVYRTFINTLSKDNRKLELDTLKSVAAENNFSDKTIQKLINKNDIKKLRQIVTHVIQRKIYDRPVK